MIDSSEWIMRYILTTMCMIDILDLAESNYPTLGPINPPGPLKKDVLRQTGVGTM
jgi:hypothetical protein